MFVGITNTPLPYAWGSSTAIAEQFGRAPSGGPEAELWLGAHPASPSRLEDRPVDLAEWIAAEPDMTLGRFAPTGRLPFLLKLLAAAAPLSLQAHPTTEQARAGFRRENEAGVPLDAPHRNYKDEHPKPELIYALSDRFEALCGFRPLASFRDVVGELRDRTDETGALDDLLDRAATDAALPGLVGWLSGGGPEVDALVALVSRLATGPGVSSRFAAEFATLRLLAEEYPADPGIVISLLLNRVTLRRGEALYLPAGNIHAYLSGLAVELMTASDNVLRGGLTPKHVDVPELLSVLDFTPRPIPYLEPERPAPGIEVFRPDLPDFVLVRFDGSTQGSYELSGPAIALCTSGAVELTGASSARLDRGSAVFVTPDEGRVTVSAGGELFLATTGS